MKKYSQSNNLPSTELKKPKIDHKMLNKEGQRHRAARHRAVGLLSRGVAVILVFVFVIFAFNLFNLQSLGRQTVSVISSGGSFGGSDVALTKFTFKNDDGFFSMIERSFVGISNLCDVVSSFFGSSFGLDHNYVYYLYESYLDSSVCRIPQNREFIIGIRYDSNIFEEKKELTYCSVDDAVFFSVGVGSFLNVQCIALYDINGDLIKRYYAVPVSLAPGGGIGAHFEYYHRFKTYPLALQAGFDWIADYSTRPFPQ